MNRRRIQSGVLVALAAVSSLACGASYDIVESGKVPADAVRQHYSITVDETAGTVTAIAYFYEEADLGQRYVSFQDETVTANGVPMKEHREDLPVLEAGKAPERRVGYRTELKMPLDEVRFVHRDAKGKEFRNVVPLRNIRFAKLPESIVQAKALSLPFFPLRELDTVMIFASLRTKNSDAPGRRLASASYSTSGPEDGLSFDPKLLGELPTGDATLAFRVRTTTSLRESGKAGGYASVDFRTRPQDVRIER